MTSPGCDDPVEPTGRRGTPPLADMTLVWDAAGRPRGRSPRAWLRSHLGRRALAAFAARRGVDPGDLYRDPGGRGGRVTAVVPIGWLYEAVVAPEMAECGPGGLGEGDLALARGLLAEEARRKGLNERRREGFRVPWNATDRHRVGVVDAWTSPDARRGDPRPRGAPPWNDSGRGCSRCGCDEAVALAAVRPDVWLCHGCRRR